MQRVDVQEDDTVHVLPLVRCICQPIIHAALRLARTPSAINTILQYVDEANRLRLQLVNKQMRRAVEECYLNGFCEPIKVHCPPTLSFFRVYDAWQRDKLT